MHHTERGGISTGAGLAAPFLDRAPATLLGLFSLIDVVSGSGPAAHLQIAPRRIALLFAE
jgi:hypothetical protein